MYLATTKREELRPLQRSRFEAAQVSNDDYHRRAPRVARLEGCRYRVTMIARRRASTRHGHRPSAAIRFFVSSFKSEYFGGMRAPLALSDPHHVIWPALHNHYPSFKCTTPQFANLHLRAGEKGLLGLAGHTAQASRLELAG